MDSFKKDPFGLSGGNGAVQREQDRDSLFLMARIRVDGVPEIDVRVRNLSEGGLMAELERPAVPGTPIEIMVRGLGWISGKVAWFAEGRAGIAFDAPVDPMLARKPVGGGSTTPYYAKPVISRKKH